MLKNEFYINYFNKPLNLYNDKNLRGYKTLFLLKMRMILIIFGFI